ncbi:MAG: ZIP family metal transporter [Clostridia bacterium]|nr:ZIP family metal transporter [Clostridia bacterium]
MRRGGGLELTWLLTVHPVLLALGGTLFTYFLTVAGAAAVYACRGVSQKTLDLLLGAAAGVMTAAAFFSLLQPAIEAAQSGPVPPALVVGIGFSLGAAFLFFSDKYLLRHLNTKHNRQSILLVFSITLHNIPEGLAVGVAFGAVSQGGPEALMGALMLSLGIGLQNFPEGAAVALPLRRSGCSLHRCFLWGQASALVEPVSGVLGAALVVFMQPVLPWALAFAAGAMIYVVVQELIPSAQHSGGTWATMGCMIGFVVMMLLDVGLS